VATTTITLPDDQLEQLQQHALSSGRSLDEVVREAVDIYLAQLAESAASRANEPSPDPSVPEWQASWRVARDGMRVHIPPAMSPDEAEALLAAPSPEARRENLRAWLEKRGARVIEPANDVPDEEWKARFDAITKRIRQAGPTDLTPEEIEREITLAREEARHALSSE
jgi:Arc/MetJ-type ribon-helix-helix transcriptional regulator